MIYIKTQCERCMKSEVCKYKEKINDYVEDITPIGEQKSKFGCISDEDLRLEVCLKCKHFRVLNSIFGAREDENE